MRKSDTIIFVENKENKEKLFQYLDSKGYRMGGKLFSTYNFQYDEDILYIRLTSDSVNSTHGTMGNGFTKNNPRNWVTVPEFLKSKGYHDNSPAIKKLLKINKLPSKFTLEQSELLKKNNISYE